MRQPKYLLLSAGLLLSVASFSTVVSAADVKSETNVTFKREANPLRIEKATDITFGIEAKSGSHKEYRAHYLGDAETTTDHKYRPNYLQIVDNRGNNKGWTLSVKNDAFKGKNASNQEVTLDNAQLVLTATHAMKNKVDPQTQVILVNDEVAVNPADFVFNNKVKVSGTASKIAGAKDSFGNGVNNIYFGQLSSVPSTNDEIASKNSNIMLEVPGESKKENITYTSNLTWTLTDDPAN